MRRDGTDRVGSVTLRAHHWRGLQNRNAATRVALARQAVRIASEARAAIISRSTTIASSATTRIPIIMLPQLMMLSTSRTADSRLACSANLACESRLGAQVHGLRYWGLKPLRNGQTPPTPS